jgi:hypothetical protein
MTNSNVENTRKTTVAEIIAAKGGASARLSVFRTHKCQAPTGETTVREFVDRIKDGTHAAAVGKVRTALALARGEGLPPDEIKKRVAPLKAELEAVTLSGRVTTGDRAQAFQEGRFEHSGWLQIDIDSPDLGGADSEKVRDLIGEDPHILAAALSPTGEGVKAIMRGPVCETPAAHLRFFLGASAYMLATYGLQIDKNTKDPGRVCYVTHDPQVTWNGKSVPLAVDEWLPEELDQPPRKTPATPRAGTAPTNPNGPILRNGNGTRETTPEDVRAMLAVIPPRPDYDVWLRIASAVWDVTDEATGSAILNEWSPEEKPGEYAEKFKHRLTEVHIGTLIKLAKEHGYRQPPIVAPQSVPPAAAKIQTINGKPAIELPCPGRPLSDFAAAVGGMLAGRGVYSRGGLAFTINHATKQLLPVDPQWLRTWAEGEVALYKQVKNAAGLSLTLRHSMSLDVARALIVSPQFLAPLPEIKRFAPVRMPVMRADGRIELLPDGFDPATLILTDPAGCKYDLDRPTEHGAPVIRAILAEFPFADARSQAAAVAAMLTVYAGGLLPAAATNPAFIYLANAQGSGKTTLAQLAGIPYGVCEADSKPATEEEWQKTLLTLVMGGARLLLLDNLKGHLNSPSFEAYLTATKFSGRILGVNKKFSGDADAVVLLTGNRLTVSPDLRRRCIFIELFMRELRAEDRVFKRLLDAPAILAHQPAILAALWCMVRGWDAADRPPASKINSSVPRWSETIAGIVEWAGFGCPSVPADIQDGGDTDTRDIAKLGEAMPPGKEFKFSELCDLCAEAGLFERFTDDLTDDGPAGLKARKGLSVVLKTFAGRLVVPGKRFEAEGKGHQRRYVLR